MLHDVEGRPVIELVDEVYRTRGRIVAATQLHTQPTGRPSGQMTILASVAHADPAATVPRIARSLGLTRQAVQQQVNLLLADGLIVTAENPEHRRAHLLAPTRAGRTELAAADRAAAQWAARITAGVRRDELANVVALLRDVRRRIEIDTATTIHH